MKTYLQRLRYKIAMARFVDGTERLARDLRELQQAAQLAAVGIRKFASVLVRNEEEANGCNLQ